jgi:hypothetical protein
MPQPEPGGALQLLQFAAPGAEYLPGVHTPLQKDDPNEEKYPAEHSPEHVDDDRSEALP